MEQVIPFVLLAFFPGLPIVIVIWQGVAWLLKPKCAHCGSRKLDHRYDWNRGYNNLCRQAIGASGTRCFDCGTIYWDQSCEEFAASLPDWCEARLNGKRDVDPQPNT